MTKNSLPIEIIVVLLRRNIAMMADNFMGGAPEFYQPFFIAANDNKKKCRSIRVRSVRLKRSIRFKWIDPHKK